VVLVDSLCTLLVISSVIVINNCEAACSPADST
jgi:hypothetical protein